jgi:hypothetical protein
VSRKFTPAWLQDLNKWEKEESKDPAEIICKEMLRTFAGGTRKEPRKRPDPPSIPPDPEAERMIAERTPEQKRAAPHGRPQIADELAQLEWQNWRDTKPRFPELEWRFAKGEAAYIRETSIVRLPEEAG